MSENLRAEESPPFPTPFNGLLLKLARLVADLTAPPLLAVPTFVVLGLYDASRSTASASNFGLALTLAILFGVVFPVGLVVCLKLLHLISTLHIPRREERTLPFLLTSGGYALGTLLLWWVAGATLLTALMFCYTINTLVVLIINFSWKISVHAVGIGGPLAALTLAFGWVIVPLYLLLPLVGWSRLYLKAHTPGQVLAGSLLGYFATLLQLALLFPAAWR